jgi:hypothetical protein
VSYWWHNIHCNLFLNNADTAGQCTAHAVALTMNVSLPLLSLLCSDVAIMSYEYLKLECQHFYFFILVVIKNGAEMDNNMY